MLNSNCKLVACSAGSPQERFLASALATTPKGACVAAAWHHPRFSANLPKPLKAVAPFWADLSAARAALVMNPHNHYYQRFLPQTAAGAADPTNGLTETSSYSWQFVAEGGAVRDSGTAACRAVR
jgi:hypothetical protein